MIQMDILPRVLPDAYFDTMEGARDEAGRRRRASAPDAITRISDSTYGGYIVSSVSAEAFVRALSDPILPVALPPPESVPRGAC